MSPEFRAHLESHDLLAMAALSSPALGTAVTRHRSSWVRRLSTTTKIYFIKTYDYPTHRDRGRGIGRNTVLAPSRVRRESNALAWLHGHGFGGPKLAAVVEQRSLGCLRRGVLVTEEWPGESLTTLLPTVPEADRRAIFTTLRSFVHRLHVAGFRDRNLDLRNLLARRTDHTGGRDRETSDDGWEIVKIDSPRHRIVKPGSPSDRLAAADWNRLQESIESLGGEFGPAG